MPLLFKPSNLLRYLADEDTTKLAEGKDTIDRLICKSAQKTVVALTLPNVRQHPRQGTGAQRR